MDKNLDSDAILARLDDQISWYDGNSSRNQSRFKLIKTIEIATAALIPFLTGLPIPYVLPITGAMGVVISILEGTLHLNQYQNNWISYRATAEALKHEKFIFLGSAPPYSNASDPRALLADRVESLVSQENSKWASTQLQQDGKTKTS
ncbi:MAG TPA: DUF4231 domain-containing protein [Terriglobales bacterium]|jgi:hypothetical protein